MSMLVQLNKPSRDFEMIPRRLCRLGLSAEAVGLLVIVACAPDGRKIDAAWIERETGFKRDKRQLVMRELVAAGLLAVKPDQGADGRWAKIYVFDWDILLVSPRPDNPVSGDRGRIYRRRQIRSSRSTDFPVIEESETETADAPAAPPRAKRSQSALSERGNTREAMAVDNSASVSRVDVSQDAENGQSEAVAVALRGSHARAVQAGLALAELGYEAICPVSGLRISADRWLAKLRAGGFAGACAS